MVAWDRWIAGGFAIGSVCFFIGPFPGFQQLVGPGAVGVVGGSCCPARPGYDLATGFGSPMANQIAALLGPGS